MRFCPQCKLEYPLSQRFCLEDGHLLSLRDPYHLVGKTLVDKYRLDALIGIGGMGVVYSAHHLSIDRRVAIKILQPNMAMGNEHLMELFEREARMAGHLTHENIANVMDAGRTADGIAYIAMEWLEGQTLEDVLEKEAPMSFERAGAILAQTAAALDAAHSKRIVHRDLKPSNIMLVERDERISGGIPHVKVLDFGIAKVVSETTAAAVSAPMGTPHYASPEQFRLGGHIDGRADIYSLGVVLYRMLTGEVPFQSTSIHELIQKQLNAPPPRLRTVRTDAPEPLEKLLDRMLAKQPEDRPQSASEAAEDYLAAIGMDLAATRAASPTPLPGQLHRSSATFDLPTRIDEQRTTIPNIHRLTGYVRAHPSKALAITVAIVAILAAGVLFWRYRAQVLEDRKRLAFSSFENVSGDQDLDALERIAPELLRQKLAQVPQMYTRSSEQMSDALRSLSKDATASISQANLLEAARLTSAGTLVSGTISRQGNKLDLTARLTDVTRGGEFFTGSVQGTRSEDIFSMIDQLAGVIASHYGLSIDNSPRIADLTTASFEAFQFYHSGYEHFLARDFKAAVTNLENATKIDEKFALAYLQLGRAYRHADNREGAKEALSKAMELRDRTGERDRMLIEAYNQWHGLNERQKADESFERMLTKFPNDKEALLSLAILNRELRRYDRSIEFARRATSQDARFGAAWNTMGYSFLLKRDYVNAIDAFKRYAEAEPENPNPYDSLGDTYTEAHLYDEAIAAYQRSFVIKPDFYDFSALWKRAEVHFLKGDLTQATAIAEQFLRNTTDRYRYLGEITLARIELYQGRLGGALKRFENARTSDVRAGGTSVRADVLWREGVLLAGLRQYDKALDRIQESRRLTPQGRTWIPPYLLTLMLKGDSEQAFNEFTAFAVRSSSPTDFELRARDAHARGDYATAIGLWKNLREQLPTVSRGYDLGLAYFASGQKAEAERELRDLVKGRPVPDLGSLSPINPLYDTRFILAHYELARVLESEGKTDEAARYYKQFLTFWRDADFKLVEIDEAKKK